ncbi:tetratricopeptide repeat protein [Umezakia ovalisporum]|uniref:Tetratricopeptide repeat protein n=2 Tax=Umezakia ovalisporum TaxID=75695 RepID=A0AA43GXX4_9CYAN|nr:tetratricopeptide repeat protein [Umezakia ovalisporum]MBI1240337.1 tetratricopeptide repeat protein [Nostoc sp. RI_552]MDH6058244.1 tetratricopeptide repeat protein [Umezakia ovalisporum FSS-43]MDH6063814.1 tetratricopeptide repeat protein [Umezakia ovalisporum FSS-62]MDH6072357.1 tetratricopeptide repeat protein [Umezakia ovalisporum CobakiLakeA]MDH6077849.1 tetratricopeptide repeat protein [Umezakia ovalisporum FSS-45]
MYKHISVLVGVVWLGFSTVNIPSVAQASVLMAQTTNPQLKRLFEEGEKLVKANDYDGAIAIYQEAAEIDPRNARIHSGIGYLYAQQGNFPLALESYGRAIAINPNNSDFHYAMGYIKVNLNDIKGAKESYRRAVRLNRNNLNAYLGLGITQARLGDFTSASWAYEEAIKLDPNNPETYEFMAKMYKQRGQIAQVNKLLRKARNLYERRNDSAGVNRINGMLQDLGG